MDPKEQKGSGKQVSGNSQFSEASSGYESIRYLFVHIPKTAGTSFRAELEKSLGPGRVFPGKYYLRGFGGRYPGVDSLKQELVSKHDQIEAIVGHYPYQVLHGLAPNAKRLVFLREPESRAISFLKHARKHFPHCKGKSLEEIAGLDTGVPNPQIFNLQTTMLSSVQESDNLLCSALSNLEQFEFVGITEDYRRSIQRLNAEFGLSMKGSFKLNRNRSFRTRISGELRNFVECANSEDAKLYLHARKQLG